MSCPDQTSLETQKSSRNPLLWLNSPASPARKRVRLAEPLTPIKTQAALPETNGTLCFYLH